MSRSSATQYIVIRICLCRIVAAGAMSPYWRRFRRRPIFVLKQNNERSKLSRLIIHNIYINLFSFQTSFAVDSCFLSNTDATVIARRRRSLSAVISQWSLTINCFRFVIVIVVVCWRCWRWFQIFHDYKSSKYTYILILQKYFSLITTTINHTNVIVLAAATTTTQDTNDDDGDDNQDQQRSATSDCAVKNGFTNKPQVKTQNIYLKISEIHLNYLLCWHSLSCSH